MHYFLKLLIFVVRFFKFERKVLDLIILAFKLLVSSVGICQTFISLSQILLQIYYLLISHLKDFFIVLSFLLVLLGLLLYGPLVLPHLDQLQLYLLHLYLRLLFKKLELFFTLHAHSYLLLIFVQNFHVFLHQSLIFEHLLLLGQSDGLYLLGVLISFEVFYILQLANLLEKSLFGLHGYLRWGDFWWRAFIAHGSYILLKLALLAGWFKLFFHVFNSIDFPLNIIL